MIITSPATKTNVDDENRNGDNNDDYDSDDDYNTMMVQMTMKEGIATTTALILC